jgi:pSer/pThr/pTyr-binding forkhead associated (FHA) protein
MADRHRPPQKKTGSLRRWPGFAETSGEAGHAPDAERHELHPAVDPRTVPVPSGLEIHVLEGEDAGKTFPLETCEIVLGRRMTPEEKKVGWILFNDSTVSRMHAVLEWRGGPRRYRLTHRSRTNPTFINGRIIQQAVLYPDDMVRLGDLTFQVRVTRRGLGEEAPPQVEDKGLIYSGFKVSVVSGPDQGRQFVLEHKVVHIGGPSASEDARAHNWLVLSDKNLPREQAFFVWYDADKKYGIFHAGASPVPTQISRVLTTPRGTEARNEARNLLSADDMVILGDTTLMMLKHERFHETAKALRADSVAQPTGLKPSTGRSAPPAKRPSPPPVPEEKRKVLEITPRDNQTPLVEPDDTPAIRVRGSGLPPHLLPDIGGLSPLGGGVDRPFDATYNWFSRPDYGLEVLDGPERGRRIALMSGALRTGRELLLGRPGRRVNDIELKDESIENEQARIQFERGRFTLINEGQAALAVNEQPLDPGQAHVLKNGDEIEVGRTILLFIDHGAMERQFQFEMEILSENGKMDRPRRLTLNQDTMSIGRSKKADIRVDDPNVSRVHAQIAFRRGSFVLEHKSETNPTFVNGVGIELGQERVLQPDDEIQLSDGTTLVFRRRMALPLKA